MELRWIERGVEYYDINEGAPMRYERVLQFREREGPMDEGWWGEWQDIPFAGRDGDNGSST